jgi:hypothetical protein
MAEINCYADGEDIGQNWASASRCAYCGHQFCEKHLGEGVCAKCREGSGNAGTGASAWFSPDQPVVMEPHWRGGGS